MRLFDKALTQSNACVREWLSPMLRACIVLNADRIAQDVLQRDKMDAKDYPYCVPPWPLCFVEWIAGQFQFGAIVEEVNVDHVSLPDEPMVRRYFAFIPISWNPHIGLKCRGEIVGIGTTLDGLVVYTGIDKTNVRDQSALPCEFCANYYLDIIGYAFTFANCKNVKVKDTTDQDQPPPKIRRRIHIPDVKRYTLFIDGKRNNPIAGNGNPEPANRRFHLCRGHFSEYTAERPLFGTLVGKFWVPQHQRGSKRVGVIEKDYMIKPPVNESGLEVKP